LAYELEARDAPPPRPTRSWRVAGAVVAAALFVLVGVVIGALARNREVDTQRRRAAGAEQQVSTLHQEVANKQSAIDAQQQQLARYQEQQDRLRRSIARQAHLRQPAAGADATSFDDGLYQVRVAIQPGQYHTNGSDSCYWAKLSTGDTNRVIVNN